VVDSFQPVSSSIGTRWRSSRARTRRVSRRSWATNATWLPTVRKIGEDLGRLLLGLVLEVSADRDA
jgi:hypothetical protein